jgi:hypothetical protein
MRAWRIILAVLLAVAAALAISQAPASANAAGNLAQPNVAFRCGIDSIGTGQDVKGYVDVHYNHGADHSDQAYGSYITIQSRSGYVDDVMYLDTDIRTVESATWHYVDTSIVNGVGSHGWIFTYTAPRSPKGGYARWALTYYTDQGRTPHTCHIPSGNWAALYGAP